MLQPLVPLVAWVGVPWTVSAATQPAVGSSLGGSVAFSLNIDDFFCYPWVVRKPIGDGVVSAPCVPTQTGIQTVGAAYAFANFAIVGTDTPMINALPTPALDAIKGCSRGLESGPWKSRNTHGGQHRETHAGFPIGHCRHVVHQWPVRCQRGDRDIARS